MSVYVKNLVINASSDFNETFELIQSGGNVINLVGFAGTCFMRKTPENSSYVGFGVSFIDRANGKVNISMASTITSTLKPGRYVYDVVIIDNVGAKTRVVEGMALVREGVTR